ncbi:interleukin-27 receptor subunit alpha [Acomys russatus]|uniref:interleukin-27 receptor subunit alpha n=1 Tax=Acomys russatus TaxID=60746 RepID=UPI0021E27871|nr:interleukin-27 receptor subunit alpha [Acomys russatus]
MSRPWVVRLMPLEVLLPLLPLLLGTQPQGSPSPLHCYSVGPLGILNCSWEPLGNLETPPVLYHRSQKYHSERTHEVKVPSRQSWVTIPREQFTMADQLLIWGTQGGKLLWPPNFVNLETQMKPDSPQLFPDVDFSEEMPLEAIVPWAPPLWPPQKVLICQFRYKRRQGQEWTQLEPQLKTDQLTPVEMQNLAPGTRYQVSGRCRVENGYPWGEWSPDLSFQTPLLAPEDVWVSGAVCDTSANRTALLHWKDPGPCVQVTYRVWFGDGNTTRTQEVLCCKSPIPALMEWAAVSTGNSSSRAPLTNMSLVCLGPESAPRDVVVGNTDGRPGLKVTWKQGTRKPWEYVVDWVQDDDSLDKVNWTHLPPDNLSTLLPGVFEGGVPYRITVTAVYSGGLAAAPSVWGFIEESVPLAGPAVWRLHDDPPGTPAVAWGEVPRRQLRGHATHYTLCMEGRGMVCMNVSSNTQTVTLPNLHLGSFKLWVTVSTTAGQGPPGPSLWLHLQDSGIRWKVLPWVLSLWGLLLMGGVLSLAITRCFQQESKLLPQWLWERVPDPANSKSGQPYIKEVSLPQPPKDGPILEVEEMELQTVTESPRASAPLHSGYEKHFLPTPEELGLLRPPAPRF